MRVFDVAATLWRPPSRPHFGSNFVPPGRARAQIVRGAFARHPAVDARLRRGGNVVAAAFAAALRNRTWFPRAEPGARLCDAPSRVIPAADARTLTWRQRCGGRLRGRT